MAVEREYYRFTELIETHGYNRYDLIYLGENKKIPFSLIPGLISGQWCEKYRSEILPCAQEERPGPGPHRITAYQFSEILKGHPIDYLIKNDEIAEGNDESCLDIGGILTFYHFTPRLYTESDLVIMTADLEALKETASQTAADPRQGIDETIWTWPKMTTFTGLDRKTIQNRAGWLDIEFQERPSKKGSPEKGLKESDLRRIINNK